MGSTKDTDDSSRRAGDIYIGHKPHFGVGCVDRFEFWDAKNNRPVIEDSVNWVAARLNEGKRAKCLR